MSEVEETAKKLLAPGKGILAADESGGSIHKKFETMNIPDDEQHRRDYRNLFFTTPDLEKYVSGVILFDETGDRCDQVFVIMAKLSGFINQLFQTGYVIFRHFQTFLVCFLFFFGTDGLCKINQYNACT